MTFIYLSFLKLIFFVSFQHKTCLKSSRSEKSLSVRLAVLDFHTSACFFFLFLLLRLPYILGGKRTLHCSNGSRVIVYPCACEGLRVHKMYTQHSYTTHCVIACEGLCVYVGVCPVAVDIMLKVLCLFFWFASGRLRSVLLFGLQEQGLLREEFSLHQTPRRV